MHPSIKNMSRSLAPLGILFSSAAFSAGPFITFSNPALEDKTFPNVDCAVRKTDFCKFGTSIDGNNICQYDNILASVNNNPDRAFYTGLRAMYKHNAVFHKTNCIGQEARSLSVDIYNTALTRPAGYQDTLRKLIEGTTGAKDGLENLIQIVEKDGGRLNRPQDFLNHLKPAIAAMRDALAKDDMNGIVAAIKPLLSEDNKYWWNGQCAIILALQQCDAAEQSQQHTP